MRIITAATAAIALTLGAAGAHADIFVGQPIYVGDTPQSVTFSFHSSNAGYQGLLWRAGATPDQDVPLFYNNDDALGLSHNLGLFQPGQRIDLIYDVLTGAPDTFRTTDPAGIMQFAWQWISPNSIRVGIEDIQLPGGDADYNDMLFDISFTPVPAPPAPAAVLALIPFILSRSRRRGR